MPRRTIAEVLMQKDDSNPAKLSMIQQVSKVLDKGRGLDYNYKESKEVLKKIVKNKKMMDHQTVIKFKEKLAKNGS